jgi:hypothetical protein
MPRKAPLSGAAAATLLAVAALVALGDAPPARATHQCGLPDTQPLWVDYGEGSVPVDVRAVFRRPGVVVAASGKVLPASYRAAGAATVYFALKLPRFVGTPAQPADPASVVPAADRLYDLAIGSTACANPWIGLNELLGPAARPPWTPTTATYRANVLALLQRLAERGARPALFVHGNPNVTGDAAAWWAAVGAASDIVYEAYFRAPSLDRLGRIVGPRRIRLAMRATIKLFASVGVPVERIGFALGFQTRPGTYGREGLQPREAWLRVVKWNALAAQQIASEAPIGSVWSWGWGNLSAGSADPDKPAAACVYLWSRDPQLCDALAVGGPAFNSSRVEGVILIPPGIECISAAGKLRTAGIDELAQLTGDRRVALDAAFARHALRGRVPLTGAELAAAEQEVVMRAFAGSRDEYLAALAERNATPDVALGVIGDELRRQRIAALLLPEQTTLSWASDAESAELDTTTCLRDDLPGSGNFPASDKRDVGVVPLAALLPFLFGDTTAPGTPTVVSAVRTGATVTLDWTDGQETDLAGYNVYRATVSGGPYELLTPRLLARSTYTDVAPTPDVPLVYVVRAVDTSGNESPATPEIAVPLPVPANP